MRFDLYQIFFIIIFNYKNPYIYFLHVFRYNYYGDAYEQNK